MPYKDLEKRRAYHLEYNRIWREKNREELNEKHRAYDHANRVKNKGKIIAKQSSEEYQEKRRAYNRVYNAKNKEKIKKQRDEYYQKNKEAIILRTNRNAQKNITRQKKQTTAYYQKIRLGVLAKIDPDRKCAKCGCDDTRFLEVNHIKGGGAKERNSYKKDGHDFGNNMILLIHKGKRGIEDLNLLCRACNSLDHLERVHGKTGLRVMWEKQLG